MLGFKGTRIWPFNPWDMDSKIALVFYRHCRIRPWKKKNQNRRVLIRHNKQLQKFINIGSTIKVPIASLSKDQPTYYVNMLRIPIVTNHASVIKLENMVENLAQPSLDETIMLRNFRSLIQMALAQGCHCLLSLPHLPTRRTNGREPLVNYSQSHVVKSKEYLRIMQQKAMDSKATKQICESRRKERQEKQARKTFTMLIIVKKLAERELVKQQ